MPKGVCQVDIDSRSGKCSFVAAHVRLVDVAQNANGTGMTVDAVMVLIFYYHFPRVPDSAIACGVDARPSEILAFGSEPIPLIWYLEKPVTQGPFRLIQFNGHARGIAQAVCGIIPGSVGH